jgi:hypothetical protein
MYMNVIYRLSAVFPCIDYCAKSGFFNAKLIDNVGKSGKHAGNYPPVGFQYVGKMFFGQYQHMLRRGRTYILYCQYVVVFVNFLGWKLTGYYPAKNAGFIHVQPPPFID